MVMCGLNFLCLDLTEEIQPQDGKSGIFVT